MTFKQGWSFSEIETSMKMDRPLNVYLIPVDPGARLFYSEPLTRRSLVSPNSNTKGLRGWAERKFGGFKSGFATSEGAAARVSRNVWNWLQDWMHPDETLLAKLRHANRIVVHHPLSIDQAEAEGLWQAFLSKGQRRHLPWLIVNIAIAVVTVPLAVLPGPNLIGYWFAFRAYQDFMVLIGLRRARKASTQTTFEPRDTLNPALRKPARDEDVERFVAIGCDRNELIDFLNRRGFRRAGEPA